MGRLDIKSQNTAPLGDNVLHDAVQSKVIANDQAEGWRWSCVDRCLDFSEQATAITYASENI